MSRDCKFCGRPLDPNRPRAGAYRYCSPECKTKQLSKKHKEYVRTHHDAVLASLRAWKIRTWGISNAEIAAKAEELARDVILPKEGFTEIFHVSPIRRFAPFDFVATLNQERVLIDVTTAFGKGNYTKTAAELANALRLKFLYLFVKPDFTSYMFRDSKDGSHVRLGELVPVA